MFAQNAHSLLGPRAGRPDGWPKLVLGSLKPENKGSTTISNSLKHLRPPRTSTAMLLNFRDMAFPGAHPTQSQCIQYPRELHNSAHLRLSVEDVGSMATGPYRAK
jgi:hypothetical protein